MIIIRWKIKFVGKLPTLKANELVFPTNLGVDIAIF